MTAYYVVRHEGRSGDGTEVSFETDIRIIAASRPDEVASEFASLKSMYEEMVRDEGDDSAVTWGAPTLELVQDGE